MSTVTVIQVCRCVRSAWTQIIADERFGLGLGWLRLELGFGLGLGSEICSDLRSSAVFRQTRCVYSIVSLGIMYKTVTWRPDSAMYAASDCNANVIITAQTSVTLPARTRVLTKIHHSAAIVD